MRKYSEQLKKIFTLKRVLFGSIFLFASLLWFKYIAGIILVLAFVPITFLTVRYSKMIPHISAESNTGMSIFMGFIFGPSIGFIYGIVAGLIAYVGNSFVSLTYIATIFMAGVTALIAGTLAGMGFSFTNAFTVSILLRTVIAYILFGFLGIDPFERITHQFSQLLTNLIFYLPLLSTLFGFVAPFV
jgi:hypothetical protein